MALVEKKGARPEMTQLQHTYRSRLVITQLRVVTNSAQSPCGCDKSSKERHALFGTLTQVSRGQHLAPTFKESPRSTHIRLN